MNVVLTKAESGRPPSDRFAAARERLPGAGPVAEMRRQGFEAYERAGLPHRRIEDWKYTDLRVLMREVLPLAAAPEPAQLDHARAVLRSSVVAGAVQLVMVDGIFVPGLSDVAALGSEVSVRALSTILENDGNEARADLLLTKTADVMISLNAAMVTDGVVVSVADGAVIDRPIHIVHIATASSASAFTRSHLKVGKHARVTLVESFVAAGDARSYQTNDVLIVSVGDGARLDQVRLVEDSPDAVNISSAVVTLGAHAHLNSFAMTSGAGVSRYQPTIVFAGEGSQVETNGVALIKGRQHADSTMFMDHAVPHCTSREVFRAVVDDRAHAVFQGRIVVRPDAQKTDAKMMTRALLLSDEAEADNKPELEIFADDVTCGHGATTGALDESLLFYLRARGLPEREAQALLIQAFVGEAIESITSDDLRDHVIAAAERWLQARA
jgi:Fe-S cluster assembly protein SufD